ncbi:hypothetical protein [Rhodoplanes sp. SY1]|uniref:hypothetical protein n=1 Tax=Rhodoplanes sp. SY1 TaxID=3166646 RepID=UPI0038B5AB9F
MHDVLTEVADAQDGNLTGQRRKGDGHAVQARRRDGTESRPEIIAPRSDVRKLAEAAAEGFAAPEDADGTLCGAGQVRSFFIFKKMRRALL